jgi:cell division control protein 6
MNLFDDTLQADETVFKNHRALDYEYLPKNLPYRENEQEYLATCIKPLFHNRDGKHLFIHGEPGIGKTAATRFVLHELRQKTDRINTVYVNCWQKNTSYKVLLDICEQLDYKFTHNKKTAELMDVVESILDEEAAVFVFDEIDKANDLDFLYSILQDIDHKSIFLITNHKAWLSNMDQRLKSRLMPEMLSFDQYSFQETKGILERRADYAFYDGVWPDDAFTAVVRKAAQLKDIRSGLFLLKEAANHAEEHARKQVTEDDVDAAITKLDDFTIKNSAELNEQKREIYHVVKDHGPGKIGDLYDTFSDESDASISYKTFQRKIKDLADAGFLNRTRQTGRGGNTTIVEAASEDLGSS